MWIGWTDVRESSQQSRIPKGHQKLSAQDQATATRCTCVAQLMPLDLVLRPFEQSVLTPITHLNVLLPLVSNLPHFVSADKSHAIEELILFLIGHAQDTSGNNPLPDLRGVSIASEIDPSAVLYSFGLPLSDAHEESPETSAFRATVPRRS